MKTRMLEEKRLRDEIIDGLTASNKFLPSKLFYDDEGSRLFDKICELEEYYPTRTELKILEDNIKMITSHLKDVDVIIELGSGTSSKTRILLNSLPALRYYIPIDISSAHLLSSADNLNKLYPSLKIMPVIADYTSEFSIPLDENDKLIRMVYFPGSTIGNFPKPQAREFLRQIREIASDRGRLLIGVDLIKDRSILNKAYNDSKGITAAFNLNILNHVNKIFGSSFNPDYFRHYAVYNSSEQRIEMYLVSLREQEIKLGKHIIKFRKGERLLTEYSYKYTIDGFRELAAGIFKLKRVWIDSDNYFSVQLLEAL